MSQRAWCRHECRESDSCTALQSCRQISLCKTCCLGVLLLASPLGLETMFGVWVSDSPRVSQRSVCATLSYAAVSDRRKIGFKVLIDAIEKYTIFEIDTLCGIYGRRRMGAMTEESEPFRVQYFTDAQTVPEVQERDAG